MSHDPFDLDSRESQEADAAQRAKLIGKIEEEDLKWLMQSKRGRRIARRQLERAGVFQLSFNTNALTMAFNEGRRNEGLALVSKLLAMTPDQYTLMLKENNEDV